MSRDVILESTMAAVLYCLYGELAKFEHRAQPDAAVYALFKQTVYKAITFAITSLLQRLMGLAKHARDSCVVCGNTDSEKDPHISLFRFPKNNNIIVTRRAWCRVLSLRTMCVSTGASARDISQMQTGHSSQISY